MKWPQQIHGVLTADDIADGNVHDPSSCPFALSLDRAFLAAGLPDPAAGVGISMATIYADNVNPAGQAAVYRLSDNARDAILVLVIQVAPLPELPMAYTAELVHKGVSGSAPNTIRRRLPAT